MTFSASRIRFTYDSCRGSLGMLCQIMLQFSENVITFVVGFKRRLIMWLNVLTGDADILLKAAALKAVLYYHYDLIICSIPLLQP